MPIICVRYNEITDEGETKEEENKQANKETKTEKNKGGQKL